MQYVGYKFIRITTHITKISIKSWHTIKGETRPRSKLFRVAMREGSHFVSSPPKTIRAVNAQEGAYWLPGHRSCCDKEIIPPPNSDTLNWGGHKATSVDRTHNEWLTLQRHRMRCVGKSPLIRVPVFYILRLKTRLLENWKEFPVAIFFVENFTMDFAIKRNTDCYPLVIGWFWWEWVLWDVPRNDSVMTVESIDAFGLDIHFLERCVFMWTGIRETANLIYCI